MAAESRSGHQVSLVEFPADDPERALRFWSGLLRTELDARGDGEGEGWQTRTGHTDVGVHSRGPGPGDRVSIPYLRVPDLAEALVRVERLGGTVIHAGTQWAICKDSEGSPFGLSLDVPKHG
jgi:predicted enzyme related to lactoylglutathione lyase